MLIIRNTVWFVEKAVEIIIVAVIVLMIIRLIVDLMDLNPFAWTARTVRRLSDGFIIPVRGGLRGATVDPKFAPLVVILIAILLGFFLLQLLDTIAMTIAGILLSLQTGAMIAVLGFILFGLLSLYILMITVRII